MNTDNTNAGLPVNTECIRQSTIDNLKDLKYKSYCDDRIILINDMYENVVDKIDDQSIDFILTDPPYNVSGKTKLFRDYRSGKNGNISFDFGEWDYNFDIYPFLIQAKKKLREDGGIIVWTSEQLFGLYREWFQEEMCPKQALVWAKTNPLPQFRKCGYRQTTELAVWATKNKVGKDNPNFIFGEQSEMKNVFHHPIVGGKERTKHPTQKPLKIFKQLVRTHCRKKGVVLDLFLGSGTTAVACIEENRCCIGVEMNPEFFDIACKRVEIVCKRIGEESKQLSFLL